MRRRAGLLAGERLGGAALVTLRERARIGARAHRRRREGERGRIAHAAGALTCARPGIAIHQAAGVGLELRKGRRQGGWRRDRGGLLRGRAAYGGEREAHGEPQAQAILPR